MLANNYIDLQKAQQHTEDVCTGWQGIDSDRRMFCTVEEAIQTLKEQGITRGVLAIITLGTHVRPHPSAMMRNRKRTGRVLGVEGNELLVDWIGSGTEPISHHLVEICEAPAPTKKQKRPRAARA